MVSKVTLLILQSQLCNIYIYSQSVNKRRVIRRPPLLNIIYSIVVFEPTMGETPVIIINYFDPEILNFQTLPNMNERPQTEQIGV